MTQTETNASHSGRPGLLWPAILVIAGVAVLCTLGFWQLGRMQEKQAYLGRLAAQSLAEPASLPPVADWARTDWAQLELARVVADGRFLDGAVATVRTTIAAGPPGRGGASGFGRWVFQGFALKDGGTILVNRGFVPESQAGSLPIATGNARVVGYLRLPEPRGSFVPPDEPGQRIFFTRDPASIAATLGIEPAPFYVEAERGGDPRALPAGLDVRELIARIPDNHLQYALTWFGLAATLIGVFAAFAWQRRRIRMPG